MKFIISASYEPVLELLESLPAEPDPEILEGLEAYFMSFPRAKIESLTCSMIICMNM